MPLKLNEKFKPLWETKCFITVVTGGRGAAKSFAVGNFVENLSFQKGHKILFTRYALYTTSDSIIPEFEEKIDLNGHDKHFYITKSDVINKSSGTEILFRGIKTSSGNQTAKLKSIQGLSCVIFEEAEEITEEDTFNVIMQSVRQKGVQNKIILVLNPKSKDHWIYKRFFEMPGVDPEFNGEKDGVCYIKTNYLENIDNLSDEFIAEANKCKEFTPELYRYDYMGEWVLSIEGAFLPYDRLKRYTTLNEEGTNLMMIDTADEGTDHYAGLIGKLVGNKFYVTDAIFNLVNLFANEEVVKERVETHKIDKGYVETNSFGSHHLGDIRRQNENTPFTGILAKANKLGRIVAQLGWILEFMYWPEQPNDELSQFMRQMCSVTSESKDEDDAADCTASLAVMIRREYIR